MRTTSLPWGFSGTHSCGECVPPLYHGDLVVYTSGYMLRRGNHYNHYNSCSGFETFFRKKSVVVVFGGSGLPEASDTLKIIWYFLGFFREISNRFRTTKNCTRGGIPRFFWEIGPPKYRFPLGNRISGFKILKIFACGALWNPHLSVWESSLQETVKKSKKNVRKNRIILGSFFF